MSRSERLLDLIQTLRRHKRPVSGQTLADETGISIRTLYRDIATLQAQGADIEGEPGVGYVLKPGFMLPPLMFSEEEIEALVLGSRWVSRSADNHLAAAAGNALAKISAVLPADLAEEVDRSTLLVGPRVKPPESIDVAQVRAQIRAERKLAITYSDKHTEPTQRIIWPFALGFFENVRIIIAWCELRQDFRHFRTDRISAMTLLEERYPQRRRVLLKQWREKEGITTARN